MIFEGFKERSDISSDNIEKKPEISDATLSKFENLMGDRDLNDHTELQNEKTDSQDHNPWSKFENLFKSEEKKNLSEGIDENTVVEKNDGNEIKREDLADIIADYIADLKEKSEFPETISDWLIDPSDLRKISPEENAMMREEFSERKEQLKREWEILNGRPWPKYEHDVYSALGKLIRKAGTDYDAHHIIPLGMGGKNVASNITPLHAEVHYDKQGVHAPNSPYSRMEKVLRGNDQ